MSDDEDYQRAIALSLKEAAKPINVIIIDDSDDSDDFQAQLKSALDASRLENSSETPTIPATEGTQRTSFLAERALLEKERLERQKRLRPQLVQDDYGDDDTPAKRKHIPSSPDNTDAAESSTKPAVETEQLFWEGELRQTATQHAHPRKDGKSTFRLTEILGNKSELSFAILSSYSLDIAWIYQFFDPSVPVIIVAQPPESGEPSIHYTLPNWIKTMPRLRGHGCMHMKFMLLFYKSGRLRVVISTANLIDYDYRDIENSVWLQDLPILASPIPASPSDTDDFPTVMQQVLHAVHVRPALSAMLLSHPDLPLKTIADLRSCWNWSKVKVKLVPTLSGKHEGWQQVLRIGHTRLRKVTRDLRIPLSGKNLLLECQGSSIGSYTTQWLNEFYRSAIGVDSERWLDVPLKRRKQQEWPLVKIVYPSLQTVQATALGMRGGGTMFCRRGQWQADTFPKRLFHDSNSKGGRVLMHSKMIIATTQDARKNKPTQASAESGSETESDDDDVVEVVEPVVGWAYIGSHNFTPSAWGTLSGSNVNPILNCFNYELGIVLPLKDHAEADRVACFERPPRRYKLGTDLPWMQGEHLV